MNKLSLWVEKYRPNSVDGYVWQSATQQEIVAEWLKNKDIPHLLFSGSPGTGKTTLAKIIVNGLDIDEHDLMFSNGSKEGRKIEWVDKLISFCQTMPFGDLKIVLIDEADYLNPQSVQPALRNLMEEYSQTVRFILTCNYVTKIIPPLLSRCQHLHIEKSDVTEFTARVAQVLISEEIEFDIDTLDTYVKSTYPDLRKCINTLQQNCPGKKLRLPENDVGSTEDFLVEAVRLIKQGKIREARAVITKHAQGENVDTFFRWAYDNLDLWSSTPQGQDKAIIIIRNGIASIPLVSDQEINLAATLSELSQIDSE